MRFLLLNQTFHPDFVATARYLTEVAIALRERGHEVTVITGRRAYDDPERQFAKDEVWRGIRIIRVASAGLGKASKWARAADFASFMCACCWRLAFQRRHDVIVALTSPPLISFVAAWFALLKRSRFVYWVMDLNPDEAIAAGWLREKSLLARGLNWMSRFSFCRADKIIALDRFMRDRVVAKGIQREKVEVIAPWSQDDQVSFDAIGRERFRQEHGLQDKFVVMYSGNHSPCHPLDSLLEAASRLRAEANVVFCFVGGGSEFRKIQESIQGPESKVQSPRPAGPTPSPRRSAFNALCLPYQPWERLAGSLSAADLHVVVMGNAFVGTIHPCKIYNVLNVGAPVLYIGPTPSHVTEILGESGPAEAFKSVGHRDVDGIVAHIRGLIAHPRRGNDARMQSVLARFSREQLLTRLLGELEGVATEAEPIPACAEATVDD